MIGRTAWHRQLLLEHTELDHVRPYLQVSQKKLEEYYPFSIGEGYDLWSHERARVDYYRTVPVSMFPEDVEDLRYLKHHQRTLDPTSKQLFLSRSDRYLRTIFRTLGREGVSFASLSKGTGHDRRRLPGKGEKGIQGGYSRARLQD